MPFIMLGTEDNPCKSVRDTCEPTYGFKHRLSLTDNIKKFVDKVNSSDVTANLDNLEGGADALMQVLVCQQIGWDKISRKIILFASDGLMHFAGDGLLGGVIKMNDKQCHLNAGLEYDQSLIYDYPSLEELYHELARSKINVIFATTQDVVYHYDQISRLMPEISSVGTLSSDSSNILQLVESGYTEVVKRAQFSDNAPNFIKVEYKTTCGKNFKEMTKINKCTNIDIGNEYEFEVLLTLSRYPEDDVEVCFYGSFIQRCHA
jgi:integrin beta 1